MRAYHHWSMEFHAFRKKKKFKKIIILDPAAVSWQNRDFLVLQQRVGPSTVEQFLKVCEES